MTTVTKWFAGAWVDGAAWCSAECTVTPKQVRIVRVLSTSDGYGLGRTSAPGTKFRSVVPPGEAFDTLDAALLRVVADMEREADDFERQAREVREEARRIEEQRREVTR